MNEEILKNARVFLENIQVKDLKEEGTLKELQKLKLIILDIENIAQSIKRKRNI